MSVIRIDHNPSGRQLKIFGVIWLAFFCAVGWLVLKNTGSEWWATAIGIWAIAVPTVGWMVPAFMRIVYVGMAYVAFPIGFVVSYLILVIVYYAVLTPTGLMMRLFRYDPMSRHFDARASTYWWPRDRDESLDTYFRQF